MRAAPHPPRNPVGTHVEVGPGLVRGTLAGARAIGAEVVQVFTGNPRGWADSAGTPAEDAAFRAGCAEAGVRVVVHAAYLVNLGSPTPATYERSVASLAHTVRRAAAIGAEGVVVHTGSCVSGPVADGLARVRAGLLPLLEELLPDVHDLPARFRVLLEPTAGQGRSLCAGVEDLAAYLEVLEHHPRLGICLDTCHAFAAGERLEEPGGATAVVDRIVELAGPDRLRLVHANDSADPRGSGRDRHHPIGPPGTGGEIGLGCFEELLAHPATDGVPFVLETPGSRDVGDPQIALLKAMRS